MINNTLKEIAEVLKGAESVLICTHINMDGDAVGSAAALCRGLRMLGKEAYVLIEDQMPAYLKFMDKGYFTQDQNVIAEPDVSVCVDCGDFSRFPLRKNAFLRGRTTVCIDHHRTTKEFCDYNHVDPEASATGELIFGLLEEMGAGPDAEIGEAVFTAITTDTGNFQYSNTTKNCHLIMAKLYDWGVDVNRASVEIYENERLEKLQVTVKALETLQLLGGGKGAIAHLTKAEMDEIGAAPDETDGVIDKLRSIAGVEYAAFIKEKEPGIIRVSMRAKRLGNVAEIAARNNGGGHIKAAGCTLEMPIEEAVELIKKELEAAIEKL